LKFLNYPKAGNGRLPVGLERMLACTAAPTGPPQAPGLWGFAKARYCGLAKNANRAFAMLAMVNLVSQMGTTADRAGAPSMRERREKCPRRQPNTGQYSMKFASVSQFRLDLSLLSLWAATYSGIPHKYHEFFSINTNDFFR